MDNLKNKKLLKQIKTIDIEEQDYSNLPEDIKRRIFRYIKLTNQKEKLKKKYKIEKLDKKIWLKNAKQYVKQKDIEIYKNERYNYEWFLLMISFLLFLDVKIEFSIQSKDNLGLNAYINIKRNNNIINLQISRELFTFKKNVKLLNQEFESKYCEIEFKHNNMYGASHKLLSVLFILMQKYKFPLHYIGDNNSIEELANFFQTRFFSQDLNDKKYIQEFLDYPLNFKKIINNLIKYEQYKTSHISNPSISFINCIENVLRMESFNNDEILSDFNIINIHQLLYNYLEQD